MMMSKPPRIVLVSRESEYELLIGRHGTRAQAEFFLSSRGVDIDVVAGRHERLTQAILHVKGAIPATARRSAVLRGDLDRFLFEPDDTVVVVGQDGLVANVAKYLQGQPVIGVNPDPAPYDRVLVRHAPRAVDRVLMAATQRDCPIESRTMVRAQLDDGQALVALNEIFVGAKTHQSARYRIRWDTESESQCSSGIVVSTGTGATGWASSISRERGYNAPLPAPCDRRLTFFVREAFGSVSTGTSLTAGQLGADESLTVTSRMNEGGVIFGDGIETDRLTFDWGEVAHIRLAEQVLNLVV